MTQIIQSKIKNVSIDELLDAISSCVRLREQMCTLRNL